MVFPVHLQRSAVAAILDCPVWRQYTGPETLKPVALQLIWLFQEPLLKSLTIHYILSKSNLRILCREGQGLKSCRAS